MREKKLWLVITFHTTAAAIAMEKLCRAKGLPGRLIPVPRELTADCGMSWRAEVPGPRRARRADRGGEVGGRRLLRAGDLKKRGGTIEKNDGSPSFIYEYRLFFKR